MAVDRLPFEILEQVERNKREQQAQVLQAARPEKRQQRERQEQERIQLELFGREDAGQDCERRHYQDLRQVADQSGFPGRKQTSMMIWAEIPKMVPAGTEERIQRIGLAFRVPTADWAFRVLPGWMQLERAFAGWGPLDVVRGISTLLGVGSASVLSRAIGKGDQKTVDKIMGNLIFWMIL